MPAAQQTKNVLLSGTYCCLNKGDRLMQEVVAQALQQLPQVGRVTLATPFPEIDSQCYPGVHKVHSRRRNLPLSLLLILLLLVTPRTFRPRLGGLTAELTAYREADLVIDLSGDMLTEDYGLPVALSHAMPLLLAVLTGKPLLVIAQSIGPFSRLRWLYRALLSRAAAVTARDAITYQYLQGLSLNNVVLSADLAFLARAEEPRALPIALNAENQRVIGLCPSSLLIHRFARLGYDFYLELVRALLTWSRHHDYQLILLSHVENTNPKFADSTLCHQLNRDLGEDLPVIGEALSPSELKWVIARLSALVAFRMHPCIAALDTATPVLGIGYSHKSAGLFEQVGLKDWVIDSRHLDATGIVEKLALLLEQRESISRQLTDNVPALRAAAGRNLDCILTGLSA